MRPALRFAGPWTGEALTLLVLVTALVVLGLVMSLSASLAGDALRGDAFQTFQRQATWAGIGLVALFATARLDHRVTQRHDRESPLDPGFQDGRDGRHRQHLPHAPAGKAVATQPVDQRARRRMRRHAGRQQPFVGA